MGAAVPQARVRGPRRARPRARRCGRPSGRAAPKRDQLERCVTNVRWLAQDIVRRSVRWLKVERRVAARSGAGPKARATARARDVAAVRKEGPR